MTVRMNTELVAQRVHDALADDLFLESEHLTHPEEGGDESQTMEYYPDEEGDPEEVYIITIRKGSVYIGS